MNFALKTFCLVALVAPACLTLADPPTTPSYYADAAKTIGKPGTMNADGSFRINIARKDVTFTNDNGMVIPFDLGLSTYAAFSGTEDNSLVVGDVAMLSHEINAVIDALRAGGIEIVSLHNHMTTENPRLFYMHYQGHGKVAELSETLKKAFSILGSKKAKTAAFGKPGKPKIEWSSIEAILGAKPQTFPSGVVRFSNPRKDFKLTVDGLPFTPGMGLASWAAFSPCPCGLTMAMGDTCTNSRAELQGAIDAMRKAGISITAIHNHVYQGSQEVLFMHFEGEGDVAKLAAGIRNAWDALGKQKD
jgi:biotin operon repressor